MSIFLIKEGHFVDASWRELLKQTKEENLQVLHSSIHDIQLHQGWSKSAFPSSCGLPGYKANSSRFPLMYSWGGRSIHKPEEQVADSKPGIAETHTATQAAGSPTTDMEIEGAVMVFQSRTKGSFCESLAWTDKCFPHWWA